MVLAGLWVLRQCHHGPKFHVKTHKLRPVQKGPLAYLQVPSDVDVLLATLRLERRARMVPPRPPSTFEADISAITGVAPVHTQPCMACCGAWEGRCRLDR